MASIASSWLSELKTIIIQVMKEMGVNSPGNHANEDHDALVPRHLPQMVI